MRANNFDLLRHFLALSVVWHHFNVLSGNDVSFLLFDILNSSVAVKAFFVISGLLIWVSANRSDSLLSYSKKRFFRLYPALVFVLIAFSLISLFLFNQSYEEVFKYLGWNSIFLNFMHPCIGDVFDENVMCAVNGALWTIKLEVAYYIFVGGAVFLFRSVAYRLIVIFTIISICLECILIIFPELILQYGSSLTQQIPFKFYYFGLGVILFNYESNISTKNLFLAFFVGFIGWYIFKIHFIFLPLFVASFVLLIAYRAPIIKFSKFGDLSYGLYIYHFPLIQTAVYMNWFTGNYLIDFCSMFIVLVALSKLSWELIEKPSLNYCHGLKR